MDELTFLFDNQLITEVEELIRSSRHKLLLVSPYIDLGTRIIDALNEKKSLHDFELFVLFGKNEGNYKKSIRRDSLEFFKEFPNVEIRYNERLHAKFYQNDSDFIVTSLNLYDYSLANNIEVGIKGQYQSKGLLGKVVDVPLVAIDNSVDSFRVNVLGKTKEINPIEKFHSIFINSELKYKTSPNVVDKQGFKGLLGGKKLNGFKVVENKFDALNTESPSVVSGTVAPVVRMDSSTSKHLSASQIAKIHGVSSKDVASLMQKKGLINGDMITNEGESRGLLIKSYMGNKYIAYPENLPELKEIRNF
jgi:PLD-like domain